MEIKIIILLLSLLSIKAQTWYDEINGHNKNDGINGYAGSSTSRIHDFYLCSDRKYRVHYLNDKWSEEFTACQPAGNCENQIDGIAISGGKGFFWRNNADLSWTSNNITKYDINSEDGYGGKLGELMNAILIYGDDYYRTAFRFDNCTNEKYVAKKLIRPLFEKGELIINYDENIIDNNNYKKITIQLLNTSDIIFKGKIIIRLINNNIKDDDFGEDINIDLKEQLKEEIPINDDIDYLKSLFIQYFNQSMGNGSIIINFNWLQKIIGIDVAIKVDAKHYAYRGGYRINIYLSNEDSELLLKVKNVCKIFLKISGKKIPNSIKEILLNFDNFEKVDSIMNFLDTYSAKAEEVILLLILSPYLKKE